MKRKSTFVHCCGQFDLDRSARQIRTAFDTASIIPVGEAVTVAVGKSIIVPVGAAVTVAGANSTVPFSTTVIVSVGAAVIVPFGTAIIVIDGATVTVPAAAAFSARSRASACERARWLGEYLNYKLAQKDLYGLSN